MQITGIHELTDPFVGHGGLVINGQPTDGFRGRSLATITGQINSMSTGVMASIVDGKMALEAVNDFTVTGHQDVLDVLGIVPVVPDADPAG